MINYDEIVSTYCPLFRFHGFEHNFPCSIEYLLANGTLKASTVIHNPARAALAEHPGDKVYVDVAPSQYAGMPLTNGTVTAPLYAAVQTTAEGLIEISYLVLYAYQGGQTIAFRAPPVRVLHLIRPRRSPRSFTPMANIRAISSGSAYGSSLREAALSCVRSRSKHTA